MRPLINLLVLIVLILACAVCCPSRVWGQEVVPQQIVPDAPEIIVEFEAEPEPVYRSRIVFRGERRIFRGVKVRGLCGRRG